MDKLFNKLVFDNLTDGEYQSLRKLKRRKKWSLYKIIITADRCDYDNLTELMEYPEKGTKVGTFYFSDPDQLELILKAFEGLFYQTFKIDSLERIGSGVMDYMVFDDWWDEECCQVCDFCFSRGYATNGNWTCKKERKK